MGWEVAINETHNGQFRRWVFFCNTSDAPFGPVFFLCDCYDIGEFYGAWDELGLEDPRRLSYGSKDCQGLPSRMGRHKKSLWSAICDMKEYFGEDIDREDYE